MKKLFFAALLAFILIPVSSFGQIKESIIEIRNSIGVSFNYDIQGSLDLVKENGESYVQSTTGWSGITYGRPNESKSYFMEGKITRFNCRIIYTSLNSPDVITIPFTSSYYPPVYWSTTQTINTVYGYPYTIKVTYERIVENADTERHVVSLSAVY